MKLNMMTILILLGMLALATFVRADLEALEDELTVKGDPLNTEYGFSEVDDSWTQWNIFWATSAFVGQSADVMSTADTVNGTTCTETNRILGEDPSVGAMLALKVVVIGTSVYIIENLVDSEIRQTVRNWWYGSLGVVGMASAVHNYNECD